jgi:transposase
MGRERDLGKEQFWRRSLARWRRSELSIATFCQREGLTTWSFYWWRRRLESQQEPVTFLPVQMSEPISGSAGIEIMLDGGRRIAVQPGFDAHTLRQVLSVLEEPAC